jgi:uncharacterized membrane protein
MMWRACTIFYLVALPLSIVFLAVMAYFQGTFDWRPFVLVGGGGMASVAVIVWLQSHVSMNLATVAMLQRAAAAEPDNGVDAATGRLLLRKLRRLRSLHSLLLRVQGQSMEELELKWPTNGGHGLLCQAAFGDLLLVWCRSSKAAGER